MTHPRTPHPQPRDLLARCTPEQSALVQLLSVIHAPLSKHVLLNIIKKTGLPAPPGRSYTGLVLAEMLEELKNQNLIRHSGEGISCSPEVAHAATLQAICAGRFETLVHTVLAEIPMVSNWGSNFYRLSAHAMRDVRIGVYRKDARAALEAAERYLRQFPYEAQRCHPLDAACFHPFDETWFRSLPMALQAAALAAHLLSARGALTPAQEPFQVLADLAARPDAPLFLLDLYCLELLWRDRADDAEAAAAERCSSTQIAVLACCALQRGLYDRSVELFRAALTALRKETGKRKAYLDDGTGPFFILALLATEHPKHLEEAAELCGFIVAKREWPDQEVYHVLHGVIAERQGGRSSKELQEASLQRSPQSPLHALFRLMALYWCASDKRPAEARKLGALVQRLKDAGQLWLAREIEQAGAAEPSPGAAPSTAAARIPLCDSLAPVESWQSAISALLRLNADDAVDAEGPQSRLIWHFEELRGFFQITPREQKQGPSGKWSAGRNVSLKRLVEETESLDYLTPQDLLICGCIKKERGTGYYGRESYQLDQDQAVPLMIGHPHVYLDAAASVRLELVHGEPELQLTTQGEFLQLQLFPPFQQDQKLYLQKETPTRIKVYQAKNEYKKIAAIIGAGLRVPVRAKDQALAAINSLASVLTVHSDVGIESTGQVSGDATPHFHLLPYQAGLRLQILVRPFSDAGPYFRPGTGGETVLAEVDGKRLQCKRDLKLEEERAAAALSPLTALAESDENEGEWLVPGTESALELLLQLQSLGETIRVSWPQGARFKIKQTVTPGQCKLSVRQAKDYFEIEGEVKINEGLALDLRQLVDLARNAQGRFVELGDGEFLALSSQLRRYLDDLTACADPSGAAFRFHPLASSLFEDFTAAAGEFQADRYWRDQVQRIRETESFRPQLPATLQAELRGYQVEGFNWLNRLAYWGVGACLADDMGLGKTVQALAQILSMAPQGPSLVVAPTSVCLNWDSEAARFAPTLNCIVYGGPKRSELLQGLQPLDLVICSYGLLQQDAELLEAVPWQAVVLDEAQAIKNMATKRSQAAMKLQGRFKMVATGTPIENHLGELWNVFRFINPGLLGSLKQFNVRYAAPIEKSEDKKARQRLKRLIQPFILRRTKNQVLEELPPRTEITIPVELGMEEAALYEAIRKSALDNLAGVDKVEGKGELHLKILAEIMRLRRACCNPRLVLPDSAIPSSKLAAFAGIVDELRENRHKALVFSQFVGHLEIIRNYLDRAGIPYQYLDGSTPAPERKVRVDAFQSGAGDLFLISLKAGGVGLNLTAADYVIHMDPWWNPAVEDQASDRAHRIGQQRPVTIYRLVAKGTIEEKIVALHQQKRGLADSLLDESDLSGKVSVEELLALLRTGS
ncbi:ATP-dependent helicase [Geomonas subterranea]|uniref:ATP-dependent helicase n=1 Tax=Geomonas subterranea TaxID=2847989 RepID=A0ABX8LRT5_9BACT|nr:SNF2-related protein [Geomonas subterranea]QXE92220.1 ATP-dependent helicase [Geomonas subterranea]QXM09681.1 ATP-dependent helicase [Geomonas subterranea]